MGSICQVSINDGKSISDGGNDAPPREEAIKNMHLIAAGPDLLTALKRSLNWLASYPGGGASSAYEQARAAISRAEGRQP